MGVVAAFGLEPVEDAPSRAAHAAMAIQKAAERAGGGEGDAVGATVAIHTGQFTVGRVQESAVLDLDAKREAWTVLDRLVAAAEPGGIVVSEATAPFLERRFGLVPLDAAGGAPGRAFRLAGREAPGPGLGARVTTFVGRRREVEVLESRLAAAVQGNGQVIGIAGEAGMGKSRLLFEFRERLERERVGYLEGHCVSYGSAIPYLPVLDLLRASCGITETDSPETVGAKVRQSLGAARMDPAESGPYLLHLLGVKEGTDPLSPLSPEAIRARTVQTLIGMTLEASRRRPLVLAVENLHWIDTASEEYCAALAEALAGAPVLLLLTYRPGYRPPGLDKSYATQVALQPLVPEDSRRVVASVLQGRPLPDALTGVILEKAEGNPFFLEELARAVLERGDPEAAVEVPDTIQEALVARIDRLPDGVRRLLQTAAVLGREFSLRLLGAVWEEPGAPDPHLRELRRLEFLYERSAGEEPVYIFKHALIQEVASESLLPADRRHLHAAAGRALEALYAGRLEAVYDRLAHHYSKAEVADRAIEYLGRFAEKAARSYAHAEAVTALEKARTHVEGLPADARDRVELELVLREAHSLYFLGRFPESLDLLLGQRERVERLRDPSVAGPYYFWLGYTYSHLGDHEQAAGAARRAIEEASGRGDPATMGKAHYVLARAGFWSGDFGRGVEHGQQAVALLEGTPERWWLGAAQWGVAFNYGFMGELEPARQALARVQTIGEAIGDPRLQAYATWTAGWVAALAGDWEAGIEACQRSLERSPDPVNTADAASFLGYACLGQGDAARAIALLEPAVVRWREFRHRPMLAWFTTCLGEAHLARGDRDRAQELARQGLDLATDARFPYGAGLARRALGRIAGARGDLAGAGAHLDEALRTFVAIKARGELAQTHLALAEVARAGGDRERVATHFREAHRLFAATHAARWVERLEALAAEVGIPLRGA